MCVAPRGGGSNGTSHQNRRPSRPLGPAVLRRGAMADTELVARVAQLAAEVETYKAKARRHSEAGRSFALLVPPTLLVRAWRDVWKDRRSLLESRRAYRRFPLRWLP